MRRFLNLLSLAVIATGGMYLVGTSDAAAQTLYASCTQGGVVVTGTHCKINADNRCECWD